MRRLTIEYGHGEYGPYIAVIDEYGRHTGQLCFGEMLEHIAFLVIPEVCAQHLGHGYQMLTDDEREELAQRRKKASDEFLRKEREAITSNDIDIPF